MDGKLASYAAVSHFDHFEAILVPYAHYAFMDDAKDLVVYHAMIKTNPLPSMVLPFLCYRQRSTKSCYSTKRPKNSANWVKSPF